MGHIDGVAVLEGFCDLFEKAAALVFVDLAGCVQVLHILVQRNSIHVLGYEVYLPTCFNKLMQPDHIRMV